MIYFEFEPLHPLEYLQVLCPFSQTDAARRLTRKDFIFDVNCPDCKHEYKQVEEKDIKFSLNLSVLFYTKITLSFKCMQKPCEQIIPLMIIRDYGCFGKTHEFLAARAKNQEHIK